MARLITAPLTPAPPRRTIAAAGGETRPWRCWVTTGARPFLPASLFDSPDPLAENPQFGGPHSKGAANAVEPAGVITTATLLDLVRGMALLAAPSR